MLAFCLYADGIGTIEMASIYGSSVGIGETQLIGALALVQFLGVPFAFAFGPLADRIGAKKSVYLGLGVYTLVAVGGAFMSQAWHFWLLAVAVASVQGGTQALSWSLLSTLVSPAKSSEFFGFYSISSKFAGIFGPLAFGLITSLTGSSRLSLGALFVFFGWDAVSGLSMSTRAAGWQTAHRRPSTPTAPAHPPPTVVPGHTRANPARVGGETLSSTPEDVHDRRFSSVTGRAGGLGNISRQTLRIAPGHVRSVLGHLRHTCDGGPEADADEWDIGDCHDDIRLDDDPLVEQDIEQFHDRVLVRSGRLHLSRAPPVSVPVAVDTRRLFWTGWCALTHYRRSPERRCTAATGR